MSALGAATIILTMTSPLPSTKVLLLPDPRNAKADGAPLRRFRIARVRLDEYGERPSKRFDHLRRIYD